MIDNFDEVIAPLKSVVGKIFHTSADRYGKKFRTVSERITGKRYRVIGDHHAGKPRSLERVAVDITHLTERDGFNFLAVIERIIVYAVYVGRYGHAIFVFRKGGKIFNYPLVIIAAGGTIDITTFLRNLACVRGIVVNVHLVADAVSPQPAEPITFTVHLGFQRRRENTQFSDRIAVRESRVVGDVFIRVVCLIERDFAVDIGNVLADRDLYEVGKVFERGACDITVIAAGVNGQRQNLFFFTLEAISADGNNGFSVIILGNNHVRTVAVVLHKHISVHFACGIDNRLVSVLG